MSTQTAWLSIKDWIWVDENYVFQPKMIIVYAKPEQLLCGGGGQTLFKREKRFVNVQLPLWLCWLMVKTCVSVRNQQLVVVAQPVAFSHKCPNSYHCVGGAQTILVLKAEP